MTSKNEGFINEVKKEYIRLNPQFFKEVFTIRNFYLLTSFAPERYGRKRSGLKAKGFSLWYIGKGDIKHPDDKTIIFLLESCKK